MPPVTLNISNKAQTRIQAQADAYNLRTGENLTPKQWLILVIRRAVIGAEMSAFESAKGEEVLNQHLALADTETDTAINAERARLLGEVSIT